MTTNYYETFIAIADDCPVVRAEIPPSKEPKSIAQIEYEMVIDKPYVYTSDDVLYASNGERRGISQSDTQTLRGLATISFWAADLAAAMKRTFGHPRISNQLPAFPNGAAKGVFGVDHE